ncbi:MAG: selenium metabolism-associated LysR family transcriptional regulator [Arenicellales bacterium WSBS_2016_MAG_OTU3]
MADRRLQVFATVARLLSFTKAAEVLHMTQPAVTFQIRQLEDYFNTRLFDRTHNRVDLTEAGRCVKEYADRILNTYKEMENEVRRMTGDISGLIVIGASTTIGEYVVPSLLSAFKATYPDVQLRLQIANTLGIINQVEANDIDVGIVEGPVTNKNLVTETYQEDELVLVCPVDHELATQKNITLEQILPFPFITREEGSGTREVIEQYMQQWGFSITDLNIVMEFGSPESIKSAVTARLGVSILSRATLEKDLKLDMLAAVSLKKPIKRLFRIVYQRQKFRARAMEEFLEFVEKNKA